MENFKDCLLVDYFTDYQKKIMMGQDQASKVSYECGVCTTRGKVQGDDSMLEDKLGIIINASLVPTCTLLLSCVCTYSLLLQLSDQARAETTLLSSQSQSQVHMFPSPPSWLQLLPPSLLLCLLPLYAGLTLLQGGKNDGYGGKTLGHVVKFTGYFLCVCICNL